MIFYVLALLLGLLTCKLMMRILYYSCVTFTHTHNNEKQSYIIIINCDNDQMHIQQNQMH